MFESLKGATAGRGRWRLDDERLCGDYRRGRFRGHDSKTGKSVLVTFSLEQTLPLDAIRESMTYSSPRIAELLFVGHADQSRGLTLMIEAEPPGRPLSTDRSSLCQRDRLDLLLELSKVVAACHREGQRLPHLRPETIYLEEGALTQIAPRAERFVATARRSDLAAPLFGQYYVPREVMSASAYGPAAEVFSLSAVAVWLLVGEHPFGSGTYFENAAALLKNQRAPMPPGIDLPEVIERGLSPGPDDRPSLQEWAEGIRLSM